MSLKPFFIAFIMSLSLNAQNIPMYVGGYTTGESEGIYQFQFDTKTGKLSEKKLIAKATNPSYLVLSPKKDFLYAVSEGAKKGSNSGDVTSYKFNNDGSLEKTATISANGKSPCHLGINKKGNKLVVSNYGGGNFSIFPIADGILKEAVQIVNLNGADKKAHTHSAQFHKNELFVADLGVNTLEHYSFNKKRYISQKSIPITQKAGPRHFVVTKKRDFIYIINEYGGTITTLKKQGDSYARTGKDVATVKEGYKGKISCADIHLSNDEKFIYGTTRGENTIAVFKRNKKDGSIEQIQNISTEGNWPRNFTLAPDGNFLLVANKLSSNITVFSVDKKTGKLTYLHETASPNPSCLKF
ncbi:lactonase family protein [Flavicella sediminum]|uniref:lactonase family protein n=1 Tax=Flavicella sediminum TaxID=2585141 RepID=UPI00111DF389|nr:lactonase family protein [Flavicella sediminum]